MRLQEKKSQINVEIERMKSKDDVNKGLLFLNASPTTCSIYMHIQLTTYIPRS